MVPGKLRRYLETNHTNVKDKPIDYFNRLRDQLLKNKNFIAEVTKTANEKATETSYKDIEFIQRYNWVKNPFLIND